MASILIGGDIFPRRNMDLFSTPNIDRLFSTEIIELFKKSDFTLCNLEGALTDANIPAPKCGPSIKASPNTVRALVELGVDCVTLANNHIPDYGTEGYIDTVKVLEQNQIRYFGAGINIDTIQTHICITINNKKIIIYNVAETVFNIPDKNNAGVNLYDEYIVCNDLRDLRRGCDCLIVIYHGGAEFYEYPTPWLKKRFHRMADCGADYVIAQHTHCIGTQENYNGAYLLYGQGNFYFHQKSDPAMTKDGLLLELLVDDTIVLKKHFVHLENEKIIYIREPDYSSFNERNQRLAEGDTFEKEFAIYAQKWTVKWLLEFRGLKLIDRIMRIILSREKFIRYLRSSYKDVTGTCSRRRRRRSYARGTFGFFSHETIALDIKIICG